MSCEEWCNDKVSQLLNEDDRVAVLQEMKNFFASISHDEMLRTANTLELPLVFDCLNNSNTEQVDLACDVLSLCMANLSLGESTNRYGVFIERALNHPYPVVKLMALKEIERNVKSDSSVINLCSKHSLLKSVIRRMGDDDLSVATKASEIITILGTTKTGIKQLTSEEILPVIHETMGISEIIRLRIYEVIINISVKSETSFQHFKSLGLLSLILNELNSGDVLLKLNIVELLIHLSKIEYGYHYLESNHILDKLSASLDDEELITGHLIEPGILKYFGNVAHFKPLEVFSKYPNLVNRIFTNLENSDMTIVGVSLDTIGHIGETNAGKLALNSTNFITNAIKLIVTTNFPSDTRIRSLNCLAQLLRTVDNDNNISTIVQKWYKSMDDNPMDIILNYSKNPFSEFRLAGFGILNSIAGQIWGQEIIRDTPGLVEFLLDRNIEAMKDCKEAKYKIVCLLADSTVFDHFTSQLLQIFVKEGPFYIQPVTEIAIERND